MFKQYKNKRNENIIEFNAILHEDISNTRFYFFNEGSVKTMDNEDYNKNKNLFNNDKPFWGGKFIAQDADAIEFLSDKMKADNYEGKVFFKIVKRKFTDTVFPPMFYNEEGDAINGVIPKGSMVNVVCAHEVYTKNKKQFNKIVLRGIKVTYLNEAESKEEVYYSEEEANRIEEAKAQVSSGQSNGSVEKEIKQVKNYLTKVNSNMDKIVEGLLEMNKELMEKISSLETKIDSVSEENKELKTCINNLKQVCCNKEETIEEWCENLPENIEEVQADFDEFEDEIPF